MTGAQREVREARSPTEVRGGAARAVDADAAELREAWAVAEATREEPAVRIRQSNAVRGPGRKVRSRARGREAH